jgi:tetratricopeptide (TPR) repeat protein
MSEVKNLENAIRDAERNYSVGRILDAASDFKTISIIFGGMKNYASAAEFAVKSGDCWVKCGNHLQAAILYENAAQYFELLGEEEKYKLYYRKALVQCLSADRREKTIGKVTRARNLRRAAFCQSKIDESVDVTQYYSRAGELFSLAAREEERKNAFDDAYNLFKSAAECYLQIKDYSLVVRSLMDALTCLNRVVDNYFSSYEGEELSEIVKRELREFSTTVEALMKNLELVDRLEGDVLERLVRLLFEWLRRCVMLGGEVNTRLLEEVGRVIREKAGGEGVLKILGGLVSNCDFENIQVREEFLEVVELLRGFLLK